MHKSPTIVACIPAFKEEATVARVILRTQKYANHVLVCDDGSHDLTGEIAEKLGAFVIRHQRNMGKGHAVRSLLLEASRLGADVVVLLDADGQHDPSEIPMLVKPIEQGEADFVVGSRYLSARNGIPFYRRVGLTVVDRWLRRAQKTSVSDTQCGYRAFSRKALEIVSAFDADGYGVESEMLALATKNGLRVAEVPVNVAYVGLPKTSKGSPLKHGGELIGIVLRLIVEDRPLLLLGVPGAFLLMMGLISAIGLIFLFNVTRIFNIPLALISLGSASCGLILIVSSLILYVLNRLKNTKL
jgi:glycosyltransferase involved in cell wall biosynthesis